MFQTYSSIHALAHVYQWYSSHVPVNLLNLIFFWAPTYPLSIQSQANIRDNNRECIYVHCYSGCCSFSGPYPPAQFLPFFPHILRTALVQALTPWMLDSPFALTWSWHWLRLIRSAFPWFFCHVRGKVLKYPLLDLLEILPLCKEKASQLVKRMMSEVTTEFKSPYLVNIDIPH